VAAEKDQSDLVSYVAYGSSDGSTRVIYRYIDDTTRTVENGVPTDTGTASDTPTWWR
jgi:hypothetical protein